MTTQTIHVVGGGLVGPLTAIFLARKGFQVELYERRPDLRQGNVPVGKSINLVVTDRGLKALEQVDLREEIMEIAIPMRGRMLHDTDGNTNFVPYGQKDNEVINAISRGLLNIRLLEAADRYENINIHFNRKCVGYDIDHSILTFHNEETDKEEKIEADVTIGTDGAWSAIRRAMFETVKNFNYQQDFLEYGYKELEIPAAPDGGFPIDKHSLHIWPRKRYMLIALPNMDGSFTCTLFFPYHGANSFETIKTEQDLQKLFENDFPDALALMPTLAQDFFDNPTGSLVTVKCAPWHVGDKAAIIGDASHAIVPFYGQGMNCGFEDCTVLGEILDSGETDWAVIFKKLEQRRKENTDAIADMAIENFIEMRDTTADSKFQLKKKIGFALEKKFPDKFIPRYSMVMFHPDIPYAEARRRSIIQDKILEELIRDANNLDEINWDKAEKLITQAQNAA